MIEEVNKHLFPDPLSRPNYLIGVISHGVTLNSPFNITRVFGDFNRTCSTKPISHQ